MSRPVRNWESMREARPAVWTHASESEWLGRSLALPDPSELFRSFGAIMQVVYCCERKSRWKNA